MRRARTSPHVGVAASSPSLRPAEDDWLPGWLPGDEHSSEKICLTCAPSRIRTCDLLLRSNPAADAVAISDDAGQVSGLRIAVAQVIWSSPVGTLAARPALRTQHESYRRKGLPTALSSLAISPGPPPPQAVTARPARALTLAAGLAASVRGLVPAHKSGHPVHVASAVPGVSGRNREPYRFELKPPGPRLARRPQRRTYQRQA
jgi:hypothetical protein